MIALVSQVSAGGTADINDVIRGLDAICTGNVFELRIPKAGKSQTVSGYFDNKKTAAAQALAWSGKAAGVYVTLNPVETSLIGRAANRMITHATFTTSDRDITRRAWLPIDIDPTRAAGISSSEAEHTHALEKAGSICSWLSAMGWPEPIVADSGNGAHLLYRVDLPNDQKTLELFKSVLNSLAAQFNDERSSIDQAVCNAARIWKVYGTMACKGDDLPERPHRFASLLSVPTVLQVTSQESLQSIIVADAAVTTKRQSPIIMGQSLDVETWLSQHGINVVRTGTWQNGRRWILHNCPFNPEHTNGAAAVFQFANGAIAFKCHHNSCSEKKWRDVRLLVEPEYGKRQDGYVATNVQLDWPPLSIPSNQLLPVDAFDESLLPEAFRGCVMDIAERLQCPPDFSAAAALTFAGGILGRRLGIRPKRKDDWLVVPNLWGAAIGRPGVMKTPAIGQVQVFINQLEINARTEHSLKLKDFLHSQEISTFEAKAARKQAESLMKKGDKSGAQKKLAEIPLEAEAPSRRRYIVNDTTVEKLGELLAANPNGLILVRDELVGFLKGLEKVGNETQRAFMLESWSGDGRFTYDRITRETVEIEAACVSIFGGIQPGPFAAYLRSAMDSGVGDDGLVQRFQVLVWPDVNSEWKNVDRWPSSAARSRMREAFSFLNSLEGSAIGAREEGDELAIPFLRFTSEAQDSFDEWRGRLETTVRAGTNHPAFESHLSKYRSLIPSIALICHIVDGEEGAVSNRALVRALAWGDYLESHARRIYAMGLNPARTAALELVSHLRRKALPSPFRARDVYRNCWRGLNTPELVDGAISILQEHGCLRRVVDHETGDDLPKFFTYILLCWRVHNELPSTS